MTFYYNTTTIIETVFFYYVSGNIPFLLNNDGLLYPIIFIFKNLKSIYNNYKITDIKLLFIVRFFE